jgi:hypothetical protein
MRARASILLAALALRAAGADAPPPEAKVSDPDIQEIVSTVSAERIQRSIFVLASFKTRHTLSDPLPSGDGIGGAAAWIRAEFERASKEGGSRLKVDLDTFDQPRVPPARAAAPPDHQCRGDASRDRRGFGPHARGERPLRFGQLGLSRRDGLGARGGRRRLGRRRGPRARPGFVPLQVPRDHRLPRRGGRGAGAPRFDPLGAGGEGARRGYRGDARQRHHRQQPFRGGCCGPRHPSGSLRRGSRRRRSRTTRSSRSCAWAARTTRRRGSLPGPSGTSLPSTSPR